MGINKIGFWGFMLISAGALAEVIAEPLPEMQVGTIGFETGLNQSIWGENPNADDILAQVRACAEAELNDAEKETLKRILLTDMGGLVALEERGNAYLTERVHVLLAQGLTDEAISLLDKVPAKNMSADLKQLKAEALFVAGREKEACAENLMEAFGNKEVFIRAVCADSVGVPPQSAVAYEVYRESGYDDSPFLNAAGEVLFRNLDSPLPAGAPNVWEAPMAARVFGTDVINSETTGDVLWTLLNQEQVPHEVKIKAKNKLKQSLSADGKILTHLVQMADHRKRLEGAVKNENAE